MSRSTKKFRMLKQFRDMLIQVEVDKTHSFSFRVKNTQFTTIQHSKRTESPFGTTTLL
jgi:hypothetical protein